MCGRPADLHLGRRHRLAPLLGVGLGRHHGGVVGHAARLLERDEHVDGAVLQHLERADRHAELLARLEVIDGQLVQGRHGAHRLGRERGDRLVDHALQHGQALVGPGQHRSGPTRTADSVDVGGAHAVLGGIAAPGEAVGLGIDQEQADAAAIAAAAGRAP